MVYMKQLALDNPLSGKAAVKALEGGGVIIYPTETAYGLGADFLNKKAVEKVYQIKGRAFNKPLPVIVSSLAMAKKLVKFDIISLELAKKYWPGPLTLVLPTKDNKGTLALRVSGNKLATSLARQLGRPLVSTSANLSGRAECYNTDEVIKQFKGKKHQPDLILNGGLLTKNKPSTIVQVTAEGLKIIRQGAIKL